MKKRQTARDYPRTARLNTLVREIVADELERIDDERLDLVTLTSVVVDGDLSRAVVYYDHSRGEDADEEIAQAFSDARKRLQGAVGRQTTFKRTPELRFEADGVLRDALRIDEVLQGLRNEPPVPPVDPTPYADDVDVP
ncbi:30S ribosome-binding factor RbfA [Aquihabitans sp. G128]|uniref:30S ribosome-binding factor RbfA n=1 Tax=Aquihabitans sp. G128 TaxID=2849779 RepID=UPI001C24F29F|nr:30S ribosome-binding factor RbfA [Aquihabitans sp. G128]QXC62586.1 30S ribosome-binding factor RbfA [Aquihabitans sp. G128]